MLPASKIAPYIANPFLQRLKISGQFLRYHRFLPFLVPRKGNGLVPFLMEGHLSIGPPTGRGMRPPGARASRPHRARHGLARLSHFHRAGMAALLPVILDDSVGQDGVAVRRISPKPDSRQAAKAAVCPQRQLPGWRGEASPGSRARPGGEPRSSVPIATSRGLAGGRSVGGKRMRVGRPRSRGMPVGGEATAVAPPTRAW